MEVFGVTDFETKRETSVPLNGIQERLDLGTGCRYAVFLAFHVIF
jgi:hypothetical protein